MLELPYWLGCSRNVAMGTSYFPSHPEGICSTHTDYWCHESDPPGSCELPDVVGPSIRSIGIPTTVLEPVCPGQEMSGGADRDAEHLGREARRSSAETRVASPLVRAIPRGSPSQADVF